MENQSKKTCFELKKQKQVKGQVETVFFKQESEVIPTPVNEEKELNQSVEIDQRSVAKVRRDVIICHTGFVIDCDTDTRII
jgi:hypothetical protein